MTSPKVSPYGSWKSPITSDLIVSKAIGIGSTGFDGEDLYWLEMRPTEGGRLVVVQRSSDGITADITPPEYNARTTVHEYGGRAYLAAQGVVYFSNFSDQRLYRQLPGSKPEPVTPVADVRYADYVLDTHRHRLISVREDHTQADREAENTLVAIDLASFTTGKVLVSGNNFYSNPRLSPNGNQLAWLTWNHPNLPWDGTELWVGTFDEEGMLVDMTLVAGGMEESIFQPEWSPDGLLYFISDRTGWWNLYRWNGKSIEAVYPMEAEFGQPQWVFGMSTYAFESAEAILCTYEKSGAMYMARLDLRLKTLQPFDLPYQDIYSLHVRPGQALFAGGSPTQAPAIVLLHLDSLQAEVLRLSNEIELESGYISIPKEIEFPTEGGFTSYAFFYPPHNKDFKAPKGELPPLLVMSHGGPTGASTTTLDLHIQYWTSRGIAVLDVNYGGSTGYGRKYRRRLNGQWGVVDVDDCANGAKFMAAQGLVDGNRLAITGGSAGGYTTLCALTFKDVFKAGASHFGISDLEVFAKDTHKFESRYLDRLVGPYPESIAVYRARSPLNYIDQLKTPMILLQGLEDKIVPPNQAEMMFKAVKAKGLPVAYLPFEGEQHGFRKAENIKRSLEAEIFFYSKIFGFKLADPVEPVKIVNLRK